MVVEDTQDWSVIFVLQTSWQCAVGMPGSISTTIMKGVFGFGVKQDTEAF